MENILTPTAGNGNGVAHAPDAGAANIHPVVLSGGTGTRLWPLSREAHPKQFLPLLDGVSPFGATLARLRGIACARAPVVVTHVDHRFLVERELEAAGVAPQCILAEPFGRNTAPAAALAAHAVLADDPDGLLLVLPADHDIPDAEAFCRSIEAGLPAARAGALVVFGIEARWPESGYGYIQRGEPIAGCEGCYRVPRFVEKPEQEIARALLASGDYYWNSGIFLFGAAQYLEELARLQPELSRACAAAAASMVQHPGWREIAAADFEQCLSTSIDYAVLECTAAAAMVPAAFRWSDIGTWNALWDNAAKDGHGNVCAGNVMLYDVSGSYVSSADRMVVGIGIEDTIVIDTPDALLVAHRSQSQRVREAVEHMRLDGRRECRVHRRVQRPWGHYDDLDAGTRFRVKRITVAPGAKLSLQLHHHRSEHWVVVSGTARITRGEETMLLAENEHARIPLGVKHRIENPGKIPLEIIEVQSGAYLDEDDIVRFEDVYHRI